MSIGTNEGDLGEIEFVRKFNKNKDAFSEYLSNFQKDQRYLWMVRVTTKQKSKLSGLKVFTRSDCYLAFFQQDIKSLVAENDYYLSEEKLEKLNLPYFPINFSGISVKMTTSESFQILKLQPRSFFNIFGSYELGAGASLFCSKENELIKNFALIEGWHTTINDMAKYFNIYTKGNINFDKDKDICSKIKSFSSDLIKKRILESHELQKKVFNGIGFYEEPYIAFYFYHGDKINTLKTIPFKVTTGSGRSKGDYTIVLKPIKPKRASL